MRTNDIRRRFLDFFEGHGHRVVPSDSLVPSGDPSLLFTSAGMVQFKKHFLGQTRLEFKRAASAQKCLRTSDIDRVGLTARHLTFFEMLGNFSFGDYFKKDAIFWAWEFLTNTVGLDPGRLYASVYKDDDEAFDLWQKILPESRIVRLGEDSNFWTMGETGPCGPCSEILFDQGEDLSRGHSCQGPGCDCDRYIEIWNLVFTQFDKTATGKLSPLSRKNIDTGMGLERLSVAVNGLRSNFEIDLFANLISEIKKICGEKSPEKSIRIISDHVRACVFLISDGILPSNEGRGYTLRRLLRRALREGWTLGRKEPFLNRIAPVVAKDMGEAYPELFERSENISAIIQTEERNALETIDVGTKALEDEIRRVSGKSPENGDLGKIMIPGTRVYAIYDTYGLDKEIQKEIVTDWGGTLSYSEEDYERARKKAVATARRGWKGSGEKEVTATTQIHKKVGDTVFRGYETLELETEVLAVLHRTKEKLEAADSLSAGEEGGIVLKETPFYSESGGQVGDRGSIASGSGRAAFDAAVLDTQKPVEGLINHEVKVHKGSIKPGDRVTAKVNGELRRHTMRHHTATHLLHAALRNVLGSQVTQAGSLVSPEKLRFDFTYPQSLSPDQIIEVEDEVNRAVLSNTARKRNEMTLDDARKEGALAFFGDKYGSKIFVVNYGPWSTEVCGGTHCLSTGEIGLFKILSESSVGSGVRRIEAVTGEKALAAVRGQEQTARKVAEKLRCSPSESPEKIDRLLERQTELEKQVRTLKKQGAGPGLSGLIQSIRTYPGETRNGDLKILAGDAGSLDIEALKETADHLRDQIGTGIVILAASDEDSTSFVVTMTRNCKDLGYHAGRIAKEFAARIKGSGGGKELFAQGGGKKISGLNKILESFPDEIVKTGKK